MKHLFASGSVLALCLFASGCSSGAPESQPAVDTPALSLGSVGTISVVAAAAPAPPIESGPMAVYVVLVNSGADADTLTGVSSPAATSGAVHATRNTGGMSGMGPAGPQEIAAGETLAMGPGGLHIMLEELVAPVVAGDSLVINLELSRSGTLALTLPVVTYGDVLARLGEYAPR